MTLLSGTAAAGTGSYSVKVLYVIDGDTIKIELGGRRESVRLIGIDAPESKANKKAKKDVARSRQDLKTMLSLGKAATAYVKSIVKPGDWVTLEQDVGPRDRYRRILAYVYLRSGEMLNEKVIAAGYASVMTIPPNIRYQDRFLHAYRSAREGRLGLWATSP